MSLGRGGEVSLGGRSVSREYLFQEDQNKEVIAHKMCAPRGVVPCTLSFVAIVLSLISWVRDTHLRPLAQAARQRNKQLNQPTNLAAQKTADWTSIDSSAR